MRTDVWRDSRPSKLAESVMRITCIDCGAVFTSESHREGGGLAAQSEVLELWKKHVESRHFGVAVQSQPETRPRS